MLDQEAVDRLRAEGFVKLHFNGVAENHGSEDLPIQVHFEVDLSIRLEDTATVIMSHGGIDMDSFVIHWESVLPEDHEWVQQHPRELYGYLIGTLVTFLTEGLAPYGLTLIVKPSTPPPPLRLL